MSPSPDAPQTLEAALELLTRAVEAWDPDRNPDLSPMLEALRGLQLRFDPRKERVSAALCVTSMKLLEQIAASGQVGPEAAISVVGELTQGLREALSAAVAAPAVRPGSARSAITLHASAQPSGLSLAVDSVREQRIGELMVRMNMLTQEQVDHVLAVQAETEPPRRFGELAIELGYASEWTVDNALRLQQRGRGETPPEESSARDPWGSSPL